MYSTRRLLIVAVGALALTVMGGGTPAIGAAASRAQSGSAITTLRHTIQQRFPKATVQVNRIGRTSSYAIEVMLLAQPGATLSDGNGARVLDWYIAAYPHQSVYALYSYEKDNGKVAFWEYEYIPANKALRRYQISLTVGRSYPWYSWKVTQADIAHAALTGKWPAGVSHQPKTLPKHA